MWVRGLKLVLLQIFMMLKASHPMWVRGLKQHANANILLLLGRTLCGCVD